MSTLVVIPARWGSGRFPGKAICDIAGLPMVVRTWRNTVAQAPGRTVLVATDDDRIRLVCERHGVPAVITAPGHACGTDRVAEVALGLPDYDTVINVQGDEPCMAPGVVEAVEAHTVMWRTPVTGVARITDEADIDRPSVGKVILDDVGRVTWIDRVPLAGRAGREHWTQVCCYGFPRRQLLQFFEMGPSSYELRTGIELLRWIQRGRLLLGVEVPGGRHAVDVPEDAERVSAYVREVEARGGGTATRRTHAPETGGSTPPPATRDTSSRAPSPPCGRGPG